MRVYHFASNSLRRSLLSLLIVCLTLGLDVLVTDAAPRQPHAQDRVIVGFEAGASRVQRRGAIAAAGVDRRSGVASIGPDVILVRLDEGEPLGRAIRELAAQPGVAYAEPDYLVWPAAVPDDPFYVRGDHWGMYGDETSPHVLRYGSAAGEAWAAGHVGDASVHVAVIDEGVWIDHPDLAPNMWRNPVEVRNGIDDDGNGYIDDVAGWDFHHDDASVYDSSADDHGTHVAGTIAARGGNGTGVAGVNWRTTLIPVKFMGPGGGYISDAVQAIDYMIDLKARHGLHLVAANNSWSGGGYSQALHDAIGRAGDAGILFIVAAGNDGRDIDTAPAYPASYECRTRADGSARGWDCLVAVGAITRDGERYARSNWGATSVDLGAPGSDIISTHTDSDGYAYLSGSSMATAHVAGAAALCSSLQPSLTARQLRQSIVETGAATSSLAGRTASGRRLDVGALVDACAPEPVPQPQPPARAVVVVDDLDESFRRFGTDWNEGAKGYADHHFWLPAREEAKTHFAAWRPQLAAAGWYDVEVRIPASHATSRRATYRVQTDSGWVSRVRDQKKRAGTWVSLGIHRLTATPIVRLSDKTGESTSLGRRLAWDAARFVPVDGPPGS